MLGSDDLVLEVVGPVKDEDRRYVLGSLQGFFKDRKLPGLDIRYEQTSGLIHSVRIAGLLPEMSRRLVGHLDSRRAFTGSHLRVVELDDLREKRDDDFWKMVAVESIHSRDFLRRLLQEEDAELEKLVANARPHPNDVEVARIRNELYSTQDELEKAHKKIRRLKKRKDKLMAGADAAELAEQSQEALDELRGKYDLLQTENQRLKRELQSDESSVEARIEVVDPVTEHLEADVEILAETARALFLRASVMEDTNLDLLDMIADEASEDNLRRYASKLARYDRASARMISEVSIEQAGRIQEQSGELRRLRETLSDLETRLQDAKGDRAPTDSGHYRPSEHHDPYLTDLLQSAPVLQREIDRRHDNDYSIIFKEPHLDTKRVAQLLEVSPQSIYKYTKDGRLVRTEEGITSASIGLFLVTTHRTEGGRWRTDTDYQTRRADSLVPEEVLSQWWDTSRLRLDAPSTPPGRNGNGYHNGNGNGRANGRSQGGYELIDPQELIVILQDDEKAREAIRARWPDRDFEDAVDMTFQSYREVAAFLGRHPQALKTKLWRGEDGNIDPRAVTGHLLTHSEAPNGKVYANSGYWGRDLQEIIHEHI